MLPVSSLASSLLRLLSFYQLHGSQKPKAEVPVFIMSEGKFSVWKPRIPRSLDREEVADGMASTSRLLRTLSIYV